MHYLLISAACLVFATAFIAEMTSAGRRAGTPAPSRSAWTLVGLVISGALVLIARMATSPNSHGGTNIVTRSLDTAAEHLPDLLIITAVIICLDIFRVTRARRVADGHIAVPGKPRIPGADQPPANK